MRLLHFDNTGRLVLTNFTEGDVPPYAILSHRWGEGEVLFEDLAKNRYEDKAGYRKIQFCAQLAAQDRLQYFWIDTCCIDKWNLRELSRSINSMFRWYQGAEKCYVFMSDVSVPVATDADRQSTWEAQFRASKWFTRGWTLQELIAPTSVGFYSAEGHRLGDKESLEQLIHKVTGIQVEALQGQRLETFSRQVRMTWAENRETTEPEDNVYCLLGILGVVMPVSYNEGREKALMRLEDELHATNTALFTVPYSRNPQFVGKESQLDELELKLFGDNDTARIAVVGASGTGKTQLALEFAYRIKEKHTTCSIIWVDASDVDSLHQAYSNVAQKLNIKGWDDEKVDVKQLVKVFLSGQNVRQWLMIYDGMESTSLESTGLSAPRSTNLIDYVPQSDFGSVIFTTTNNNAIETLAVQEVVQVQQMTPDSAQRMFKNYLLPQFHMRQEQEIELLLKELSYLPLAIAQAAAHINIKNMAFEDYRSQLIEQKEDAIRLGSNPSGIEPQAHDMELSAIMTLLISLRQIRRENSLAADYLCLASCMDRKDIPTDLLGAASYQEREDAVSVLRAYALVTRRPAESALDIHRIIHSAIRRWLQQQQSLGQWIQEAVVCLLRVFPDDEDKSRSKWRRLLPHTKYALSYGFDNNIDDNMTKLMWKCAMSLHNDGRYDESEKLFLQVIEIEETGLGAEHPETLASKSNLASTYSSQARWQDAERLGVQVLEIRMSRLRPGHPDTLKSMSNLASTYTNLGRLKDAEQLFVQVLKMRISDQGADTDTFVSLSNLASMYNNQGRWADAEKLGLGVVEVCETRLGADHPDTLSSMSNLATTYTGQGRWQEAEKLESKVMEIRKTKLGADHPSTLTSMNNLALTYRDQGRWTKAEELLLQVVDTNTKALGANHLDTLTSLDNLALVYGDQGRWSEAEQAVLRVIETREAQLGPTHPSTLTAINNLASIYRNQGRLDKAETLFTQVVEARKEDLGVNHPSTLTAMNNLALTLWKKGHLEQAEQTQAQVLAARKTTLGVGHPSTLVSMGNLASILETMGRWVEAEQLLLQIVEAYKMRVGVDHQDTLTSMNNLAFIWKKQGRDAEAIELMRECVQRWSSLLGATHPHTLLSINMLTRWETEGPQAEG